MEIINGLLVLGSILSAVFIYSAVSRSKPDVNKILEKEVTWFGYGPSQLESDFSIKDFTINISETVLLDLRRRLSETRVGESLVGDFSYGMRAGYLRSVVEYWKNTYNWKVHEERLNKFPQYKTKIEGIHIHFIRSKPKISGKFPVLVIHGWPGSVWEFHKLIPLLTQSVNEDALEVICPSIPGYAFSEAPHQPGFNVLSAGRIFNELMRRLGHDKYYIHGGDWGASIATVMTYMHPRHVLGIHINLFPGPMLSPETFLHQLAAHYFPSLWMSREDRKVFKTIMEIFPFLLQETGYMHLQATKPDTIGLALDDSPVGLAAYILDKFATWTRRKNVELPDGGLPQYYSLDDLLTNVMIYWVTGSMGTSVRMYKERYESTILALMESWPVTAPTGLACFPEELVVTPEVFADFKYYNVVQFTHLPTGGHFAAFEQPELVANDLKNFIKKVEKIYKI